MQRELRPIVSKLMEIQQKFAAAGSRSPELAMAAMMLETLVESLRTGRDPSGQPTDLKEVVAALTFPARAAESIGLAEMATQIVFIQRQLLDLVEAEKAPAAQVPAPRLVQEGPRRAELAGRLRAIRDSLAERASVSSDVASVMTIVDRLADALETGQAPNGNAIPVADIPAGLKVPIVVLENQQMSSQVGALRALQHDIAAFAEQLRAAPAAKPERPFRPKKPAAASAETRSTAGVVGCLATCVFAALGTFFLQVLGAQVIGFPEGAAWFGAVVLGLLIGLLAAVVTVASVPGLVREGRTGSAVAVVVFVVVPWVGAGVWGVQRFFQPPAGYQSLAAAQGVATPTSSAATPTEIAAEAGLAAPARTPEAIAAVPSPTLPPLPTATVPPATGKLSDEIGRRLAYGDLDGAVALLQGLRSTERGEEEAQQAAVAVVAALRAEARRVTARDGDSAVAKAAFTTADDLEARFKLQPPGVTDLGRQQEYPSSQPDRWRALEGQLVEIVPTLGQPYEARLVRVEGTDLDLEVVSAVGGGEVAMSRSVPIAKVRSIRHPVFRTIEPTHTPTPGWGRG